MFDLNKLNDEGNASADVQVQEPVVVAVAATPPDATKDDKVVVEEGKTAVENIDGEPNPSDALPSPDSVIENGEPTPPVVDEQLAKIKELGYNSLDELIEGLKKGKEETPNPEDNLAEEADFLSYAMKDKKLTNDYLQESKGILSKSAEEIVFDEFSKLYLEKNEGEDLEDARFAFNAQYGIESSDEAIKANGNRLLELDKNRIVSEKTSDYSKAKADFDQLKVIQAAQPKFTELLNDILKTNPDITVGNNNGQTNFKSTVTPEETMAYIKENVDDELVYQAFDDFASGQPDKATKKLSAIIKLVQNQLNFDKVIEAHGEQMRALGIKEGSIGATAPFNKNNALPGGSSGTEDLSGLKSVYGSI